MVISRKHFLLSVLFLFLLSSCSQHSSLTSFFPKPSSSDETVTEIDTAPSDTEQQEFNPEPVEPDSNIEQEIQALKQTGSWEADEKEPSEISYDFPVVVNKQVEMYLNLFQTRQRKMFTLWLERSGRYMPLIQSELKKEGLPLDLAYLSLIESGFNPKAKSWASAVGLWQFIAGTGRRYNLRIDRYVDERRDAPKATKAAVSYLKDLYGLFNDWPLAVAAYNAGEGKISKGLKRYKVNTFWELAEKKYLKLETTRYVPKLIAAIIIAKSPEKYGFTNIQYEPPLQYDTIDVGPGMSIKALAVAAESSEAEILRLNTELKTSRTPLNQDSYTIKIPKYSYVIASNNLSKLHLIEHTNYITHIKKKNETLTAICRRYNISKTTLLKANNLHNGRIVDGQTLRIPYTTVDYTLRADNAKKVVLTDAGSSKTYYTIRKGDTLTGIAKKYNTTPEKIAGWNNLRNVRTIRPGQQLEIYSRQPAMAKGYVRIAATSQKILHSQPVKQLAATSKAAASDDKVIVLTESRKRLKASAGTINTPQEISMYQVQKGDTLWRISRKFNISMREIKKWNNLNSNIIQPGSLLKLKDV